MLVKLDEHLVVIVALKRSDEANELVGNIPERVGASDLAEIDDELLGAGSSHLIRQGVLGDQFEHEFITVQIDACLSE